MGFTLIEFIGVLAVISILAALTVPAALRQIDRAAREKESIDLDAIRVALTQQILNTRTISHESGMAAAAAAWARRPIGTISVNPRGYARAFLIDTNGWFGTAVGALPFQQSVTGSITAPVGARLMIVSSIAGALPVSNVRLRTDVFNDVWNTPEGAKPNSWVNWPGRGEDLLIQRVNLEPLFHRLVIVNRDRYGAIPRLSIDTTNTLEVALGGAGRNAFYLDGTMVGLCDPAGVPIRRFTLTRDFGYVFEGGIWRDGISSGDSSEVMAQEFAALATRFLAAQWYPGANQGGRTGDQQGSLTAMFNFMLVFGLWANPFPHFPRHGATAEQVPEYILLEDIVGQGVGNNAAGFLNEFTGPNGLLN